MCDGQVQVIPDGGLGCSGEPIESALTLAVAMNNTMLLSPWPAGTVFYILKIKKGCLPAAPGMMRRRPQRGEGSRVRIDLMDYTTQETSTLTVAHHRLICTWRIRLSYKDTCIHGWATLSEAGDYFIPLFLSHRSQCVGSLMSGVSPPPVPSRLSYRPAARHPPQDSTSPGWLGFGPERECIWDPGYNPS